VLFIVFGLIAITLGIGINFLVDEIPKIDCSLTSSSANYAEGLPIDGVTWQKDFKEYFLWVRNNSKKVDGYDLNIDMDMIGGIVKYEISSQQGCEGIFFARNTTDRFNKAINGVITETTSLLSNNLRISTAKLAAEGHYKIRLIVKTSATDQDSGTCIIKYRYLNAGNEKIDKSFVYKILVKDKISKSLYIDTAHPIIGHFERKIILTPYETLKIVDGHKPGSR